MKMDERLDDIAKDLVKLFYDDKIPIVVSFCTGKEKGGIGVGLRFSASVTDMVHMISAQITQLSKDIGNQMNLDDKAAVELTLAAIKDYMITEGEHDQEEKD